ncbi:MAG TPA: GntR family transcriptional regulator [Actinomycetaceae bacterium]|nr:GntR family transcriptional regulator [Actinomycetaceae bacterium]
MPVAKLTPPRRQSTVEYLAEQLRDAVMTGALPPGTQLGEADLAERFEVSRGPLREAMQRLVSEGLLHAITNRGVFVSELTAADVRDVYRTRSVIERGALEIVLAERRQETYRALGEPLEAMRAAAEQSDGSAMSDADLQFHDVLVDSSASPRLRRAMRTLLVETRMCLGALEVTYPDLWAQVREHEELREAIAGEPAARVKALLEAHLDDAVERLAARRTDAES